MLKNAELIFSLKAVNQSLVEVHKFNERERISYFFGITCGNNARQNNKIDDAAMSKLPPDYKAKLNCRKRHLKGSSYSPMAGTRNAKTQIPLGEHPEKSQKEIITRPPPKASI